MKRNILIIILMLAVGSTYVVAGAGGAGQAVLGKRDSYRPDTVLVRFKPGASEEARQKLNKDLKAKASKSFRFVDGLVAMTLPPGRKVEDAIAQILKNPNVLYAEPDYVQMPNSTNDPGWSELWGLNNTGQLVAGYYGGTADADMNIPEAWSNSGVTGDSSIVIGVIDTGINYNHEDLQANLWVNPGEIAGNGIDDDGNGYVDDIYGANAVTGSGDPWDGHSHGTHVAGTIAAVGNNGVGMTGVVQQAKIVSCKSLPDAGGGSTLDAIECLEYMYNLKQSGVNLVATNNSWGGGGYSQSLKDAIAAHRSLGILFVAAAGNDNTNNDSGAHYPSNYFEPNVISVAATDQYDARASFSNYGRRSVHIGAPGTMIYSTYYDGTYTYMQGTSMATPNLTGVIALLKAANPSLDWKALKNLTIAGGTPTSAMNGNTVSGRRARAWDNNGTGAMSCSNQTVQATIWPQSAATISKVSGADVGLAMMNINCANPAGDLVVTTTGPEAVPNITLRDDGQGFDAEAGDGIYSAYWTAPATAGSYTITMADGQTVSVSVTSPSSNGLSAYRAPVEISYNPRTNAMPFYQIGDTGYFWPDPGFNSYFKIPFGGNAAGYTYFYGNSNGSVTVDSSITYDMVAADNQTLPTDIFETVIAAFWDDLDMSASGNGYRAWWWYNGGSSPVGEVVMEWRGVQKSTGQLVQVQVVFTANSPDIEVHYISAPSSATSATVGVQVDQVRAHTQGYNETTTAIASGKAWKWSLDNGAPTVNAGNDQTVDGNTLVNLSASATDPDGGAISYQWTQLSGEVVSISNATSANASFTAPNLNTSLVFKVTATDDAGQTAYDTVTINVNQVSAGPGTIAMNQASYSVAEDGGSVTISVNRSGGNTGAVSVSYASSNGTASAGSDYTAASGTLSWADGEDGVKSFTITINDDSTYEGNETLSVAISNATGGATLGSSGSTVTITENDPLPVPGTLSLTQSSYTVAENGTSVTISVNRSGGSDGAVSVNYATSNSSASAGSDYNSASGTLNWADGEAGSKSFTVTIIDDSSYEGNEIFNIGLSGATGDASIGTANAIVTITENDPQPVPGTLALAQSSYTVAENGTSVTISVNRTGGSDGAVSVNYATSNGSASAGSDYVAASGTLNWADGDSSAKTITVTISDDVVYEGNESFTLSLSGANGGASLGGSLATVTITENDAAPAYGSLGFSNTSYSVNENAATVSVTVSRSNGSSGAVSVNYATSNGTASAGSDYVAASGTLNWADGDIADKSFTITISDDSVYEGNETVSLSLSSATGGSVIVGGSATLTINDNDQANVAPTAPKLYAPGNGELGVTPIFTTFEWFPSNDANKDSISYDFYYCTDASFSACSPFVVAAADSNGGMMMAGIGGGSGLLMLGMVYGLSRRRKWLYLGMAVVAMSLGACKPEEPGKPNPDTIKVTVTVLDQDTTYYWKVVAKDGKGGETSSEVWSFTTGQ